MEGDDTPGHHGLRTSYGSGTRSRRCIEPDEQRHAESDEKHEQERDTGRGSAFAGGIHMAGLHDHTEYEGRQQHLDMDTPLFAVKMFGDQINHLGYSENCNRIEEDGPPLLPQVIGIQLFHPSHRSRNTISTTANNCHRRPIIMICSGIISRMVSKSSKMANT